MRCVDGQKSFVIERYLPHLFCIFPDRNQSSSSSGCSNGALAFSPGTKMVFVENYQIPIGCVHPLVLRLDAAGVVSA